jgi:hypothetical protein
MNKISIILIYAVCGSQGERCVVLVDREQAMTPDALIVGCLEH